jgi:hypothetical protein
VSFFAAAVYNASVTANQLLLAEGHILPNETLRGFRALPLILKGKAEFPITGVDKGRFRGKKWSISKNFWLQFGFKILSVFKLL